MTDSPAETSLVAGLRGDDLLLNLHQQLLPLRQRQTQVRDVSKTIRSTDLRHVETSRLTVHLRPDQTQRPFHPGAPSRQHNPTGRIVLIMIPQSLDGPLTDVAACTESEADPRRMNAQQHMR
jgi:hypothetical protein